MNKFVFAFLGLLGGLSLIAVSHHPAETAMPYESIPVPIWSHEVIGPGGFLVDVESDTAGDPHLLYVDASAGELRYARRVTDAWSIIKLADFPVDLPSSDLAIDLVIDPTTDEPVVAFVDTEKDGLYVGRRHGGIWWFERVADGGRLLSLQVDPAGGLHLTYVSGRMIHYYSRAGEAWQHETIGQPLDYVWNLFLALDNAGFPHVAGTGSKGSFYAQRLGPDAWDMATLPVADLANIEGLALDPDEQPHFLVTESEIMYGRPPFARVTLSLVSHSGGQWQFTPLWEAYDWYLEARLVAGADGTMHVSYYDEQARPHFVSVRADGFVVRDRPFEHGWGQIALAFDADSHPYVAHVDGQILILSHQGLAIHDEVIYGLVALN